MPSQSGIFNAVVKLAPDRRAAFLDEACGSNRELRNEVESLLQAHDSPDSFLRETVDRKAAYEPITEHAGTALGPYKLLEPIGEGGFGVVFLAEQTGPVRRKVALKVLKPGMDTREVVARFEAERQALALMDHPNIARVFDGGTTPSGRPYVVMELVKGIPITEFCDQNRMTPRQRLELFVDVCQAVQHAHQKGVIHRDLKPSNVLVTRQDVAPVVKVIDFGVAKAVGQALTDKLLCTAVEQMVGTPLYMSPEQAGMSGLDVDTRSDIYSLGVLLYELLTGTTPFAVERLKTATFDEIRRIIREEEPPRPSTRLSTAAGLPGNAASRGLDPRRLSGILRGELDWVVMKALEKDRKRRYETANSFAADVRRYLADEPVQACPPSAWYRFGKFARRNRREVLVAGLAAAAGVAGVVGLGVSRALVLDALREARVEAYFQRITVAHRELSADNLAAALRALEGCPADLRGWEWHYLMRLCKVEPLVIRDEAEVHGVAFSPDGGRVASGGKDGKVKFWTSTTGEVIREFLAHVGAVCCVTFCPGGRYLASSGTDRLVKVWDLATHQEVFRGPCDAVRKLGSAYTVAFSPDGRLLAAGSDGTVRVWDWKDRQLLHTLAGHEHYSISVAFSPDGRRLATGSWGEGQRLWDTQAGGLPLRSFPAHRHPVSALAFSPDGGRLASASFDRSVKVWDATTGGLRRTFTHSGNVDCVAFSPDGRRIASSGEDKTVRVWDATTGREVLDLRGHADRCGCVAFSPDGRRLASASTDGTIRLWDATPLRGDEGQETLTFTGHDDEIRNVAVSPDGGRIVSAGHGTLVRVWNAAAGRVLVEFPGHTALTFSVAWHPDGQRIATAGSDGTLHAVKVWDSRGGREHFPILAEREKNAGPFTAVAFCPDGRYLVTGRQNGAVQVWDAGTGQNVGTLGAHDREIRGVVFSRDGRHLASASGDGEVKLWDATRLGEKQEARRTLRARVPGPSLNVAFSPDGRRLATGGAENTVKIWDVQTGQEFQTLRGHGGEVYTVAFSPDDEGRWVASGGEDSTVKVWDSHTGKLVRSFRGHTGLVSSAAFSPDGRRLYSGSRDKTVKVWDVSKLGVAPDR